MSHLIKNYAVCTCSIFLSLVLNSGNDEAIYIIKTKSSLNDVA